MRRAGAAGFSSYRDRLRARGQRHVCGRGDRELHILSIRAVQGEGSGTEAAGRTRRQATAAAGGEAEALRGSVHGSDGQRGRSCLSRRDGGRRQVGEERVGVNGAETGYQVVAGGGVGA